MFIDFRERGRERKRETLIACLPYTPCTRDGTHKPGMCPDWELSLQPFGAQDNAPTNWATPATVSTIALKACISVTYKTYLE